jgi:hypothetical protein
LKRNSVPEIIKKLIMDSGLMENLKGDVIDHHYINEFETQGYICFWNGKVR